MKKKEAYIATFCSHFGAIRFSRSLELDGYQAEVMPVPRSLSSSCGTCVWFEALPDDLPKPCEEMERIVKAEGLRYVQVYCAEDS